MKVKLWRVESQMLWFIIKRIYKIIIDIEIKMLHNFNTIIFHWKITFLLGKFCISTFFNAVLVWQKIWFIEKNGQLIFKDMFRHAYKNAIISLIEWRVIRDTGIKYMKFMWFINLVVRCVIPVILVKPVAIFLSGLKNIQ